MADRYDKALARAAAMIELAADKEEARRYAGTISPELAESEDERIRQAIIEHFAGSHSSMYPYKGFTKGQIIAWLEKQGKQPKEAAYTYEAETGNGNIKALVTEKVQLPKFKVGDWISGYYTNYKVMAINSKGYEVEDTDGNKINILFENEKFHHLFTIADAKDGDVLATSAGAFIYNGKRGGGSCPGSYCGINTLGRFQTGVETHWTGKTVNPATNEQRDTLFAKMKEAGYEWNAENKELKKIEQKSAEWSEEDDIMVRDILGWLPAKSRPEYNQRRVEWLKSLKDRVQPQSKCEWSEEDENKIDTIIQIYHPSKKIMDWLKSLKQRCTWKPSDEQIIVLELASKYERVFTHKQIDILIDLKEQLKKLTE